MQEKENSNRTEFSPEQQRAAQELLKLAPSNHPLVTEAKRMLRLAA